MKKAKLEIDLSQNTILGICLIVGGFTNNWLPLGILFVLALFSYLANKEKNK